MLIPPCKIHKRKRNSRGKNQKFSKTKSLRNILDLLSITIELKVE